MNALLGISRLIDAANDWIGQKVSWLLLVATLICAGNAIIRKVFNVSSNSFLEIQWYLFGAVFLFAAAYTLNKNEHVRIDIVTSKLSPRGQLLVDLFGTVFFLIPLCLIVIYYGWPYFLESFQRNEESSNAGGLIRWPVKLLLPVGFGLLLAQALSQLIKIIAALSGHLDPKTLIKTHSSAAEEVEELLAEAKKQAQ